MPLDESIESFTEAPAPVMETPPEAPAEVIAAPEIPTEAPVEAPAETVEAPVVTPAAPAEVVKEVPAFDEKAYLKSLLGDDAPETAAEARTRIEAARAKQVTPDIEARLAVLADADKLREYAQITGKDYDKPTAAEIMRERFAHQNPDMDADLLDFRFSQEFARKYPTLAAAIENPSEYSADDPQLVLEKKAADYDAKADRTFFKEHQQTLQQQFLAQAAPASTAPQYTPEEIADAQAVVNWSDATLKDGFALPIDVGNGQVVNMPIGEAAAFKAGFLNTDALYKALVLPDGKIDPLKQAKVALFLQNPAQYDAFIANAVKGAQPPALPIDELTNSSTRRPAKAVVPEVRQPGQPVPDWQKINF